MARPVRHVAVVGRDVDVWLVALGLKRATDAMGVEVTVVELPSTLEEADLIAGLPTLSGLHGLLGLRAGMDTTTCDGVPVLGHRFAGWGTDPFMHAYDIARPGINDIDFLQFWVAAQAAGLRVPLEDFSLAAAAAKQGRISTDGGGSDTLAGFVPGVHLDAPAYVRLLSGGAASAGINRLGGHLAGVEREGETIRAIRLEDGARIEADLFVDASGPAAEVIGGAPGGEEWESWSHWLPCDRVVAASAAPLRPLPAYAQVNALLDGWLGMFALQHRTAVVAALRADGRDDETLVDLVRAACPFPLNDPIAVRPLRTGARPRSWIGNCVAVGAAAAALEPLDAAGLQITQVGLSNLISLWPIDVERPVEANAFNRAVSSHLVNLRDFQIAHYCLNGRRGEPFWDAARTVALPPTLAPKLSLFAARGIVPLYDDETFQAQNWSACFVGHGLVPRSHDPLVDRVPAAEQMAKFQQLLRVIADEVGRMSTVDEHLAQLRSRTG